MDISDLIRSEAGLVTNFTCQNGYLLYWKLGLYKGDALEAWVAEKLALKGISHLS